MPRVESSNTVPDNEVPVIYTLIRLPSQQDGAVACFHVWGIILYLNIVKGREPTPPLSYQYLAFY